MVVIRRRISPLLLWYVSGNSLIHLSDKDFLGLRLVAVGMIAIGFYYDGGQKNSEYSENLNILSLMPIDGLAKIFLLVMGYHGLVYSKHGR